LAHFVLSLYDIATPNYLYIPNSETFNLGKNENEGIYLKAGCIEHVHMGGGVLNISNYIRKWTSK